MEYQTLEREAEINQLEAAYPDAVKAVTGLYSERRCFVANKGELIYSSTVRAQSLAEHYAKLAASAGERKSYEGSPGIDTHSSFDNDESDWAGLGRTELSREFNGETKRFQDSLDKARSELAKTGLKESLEENMVGMKKKRKRFFNEHDGDWDLDRKFDTTPFLATLLAKREFPYIEIIFPMSMNSGASKEEIAKFGARCLALAEIFEHVGYRVAITGENWQGRLMKGINDAGRSYKECCGDKKAAIASENQLILNRIIIRDANEYGDVQSFAAYTSTEFFRRAMFGLMYTPAHYIHGQVAALSQKVDYAYGRAIDERPIPAAPGQLVLSSDLMRKLFDMGDAQRNEVFQSRVMHTVSRSA